MRRPPVDAEKHDGAVDLELASAVEAETGSDPVDHPSDGCPRSIVPRRIERPGQNQAIDRACHRNVVETPRLVRLGCRVGTLDFLVPEGIAMPSRNRIGNAEPEAPIRQAEDLLGRRAPRASPRVTDNDDSEFETLCRMDRQEPDGLSSLLLRHRLDFPGTCLLLVANEADEALEVGATKLLIRPCEPRQLPEVRVSPLPVPAREHCEVVVVLGDDPLAQALEPDRSRERNESLVALPKRHEETPVALGETLRRLALESREQRPATCRAPEQDEGVVRDTHQRRCEDGDERLVVIAVLEQSKVREQVDDLLLPEVPATRRTIGRKAFRSESCLVRLGTRSRREQEDDFTRCAVAGVDQLAYPPSHVTRFGRPPAECRSPCSSPDR